MNSKFRKKLFQELIWLIGLLSISAIIEYVIIFSFDLHPILSVKIQGLIGLLVVAYGIRMIARLGKEGIIPFADDDDNGSPDNEREMNLN